MSIRVTPSASTSREKTQRTQHLLLWAGIIAPILFAVVFMIDGFLKPGYSAYSEAISYLEVGTNGTKYTKVTSKEKNLFWPTHKHCADSPPSGFTRLSMGGETDRYSVTIVS